MMDKSPPNYRIRKAYTDWSTNNVRYSDLDPNGHVNNGAINTFFEEKSLEDLVKDKSERRV